MSRKRARERPAVDTQLVEIYEDLANVEEPIRLKAAHALLSSFAYKDEIPYEQILQILKRLFRGICSGRKAARLGFSVALTEFLAALTDRSGSRPPVLRDANRIVELLKEGTQPAVGANSQEGRDHNLGLIFGADAVIKCGALFHPELGLNPWSNLLDEILVVAKKKPWLREHCGFVLFQAIQSLRGRSTGGQYVQLLLDKSHSNKLLKTPEGVAIWLAAQSSSYHLKFPGGVWHQENPLNRRNLSKLPSILREAFNSNENEQEKGQEGVVQKGSWNSNLNFAWSAILDAVRSNAAEDQAADSISPDQITFAEFWFQCVDNGLFEPSASPERKFWGFQVFQKALFNASTNNEFQILFSHNMLRCFLDHLSSEERYLHLAAEKVMALIVERAVTSPQSCTGITGVLSSSSRQDVLLRTEIIETLLDKMTDEMETAKVLEMANNVIIHAGNGDVREAEKLRHKIADQLGNALRYRLSSKKPQEKEYEDSDQILCLILELLAQHAYFDLDKKRHGHLFDLSAKTRELFKTKMYSCLTDALASPEKSHVLLLSLSKLLLMGHEEPEAFGNPLLLIQGPLQKTLDRGWDTIQRMCVENATTNIRLFFKSAAHLSCLTFLQICDGDPDAFGILEELNECFSKEQIKTYTTEDTVVPSAVVEILISFLSRPSQLYRRIAQQVFETSAAYIDQAGLDALLNVLEIKESLAGQSEIFERNDEGSEAEEDDAEEASEMSDVEEIENHLLEDYSSGSEDASNVHSDSSVSDDEVSNGEDDPDEGLAAFNAKLAAALRTRSAGQDGSASPTHSTSTSSSMNSSQMEALDEHLSAMFREREKASSAASSKKREHKDAKENVVNLKCRVLELLETFVKKASNRLLTPTILLPILNLLRTTSSPLVTSKASTVIREYARICKGGITTNTADNAVPPKRKKGKKKQPPSSLIATTNGHPPSSSSPFPTLTEQADVDNLFTLLSSIHEEAGKGGSNAHATACSQASLLLVKTLAHHDTQTLRRVTRVYAATQESMLFGGKRCKVRMGFFTDWLNWCSSARDVVG